jgi:hypothetical protein
LTFLQQLLELADQRLLDAHEQAFGRILQGVSGQAAKQRVDLHRFRGLFKTENGARKGEDCHEQTRPTHRSFAQKLSGFLEPPMRSIPSPGSPERSAFPMAPLGTE